MGARVADHRRCWARHQTITDPAHTEAAAALRQAHRDRPTPPSNDEVAYRDLSDHDRMFRLEASELIGKAV